MLSFVDLEAIKPLKIVVDAANGMAGVMLRPCWSGCPGRGGALLLRAGRHLPQPRAESASPREPRVHRPQDARGGGGLRGGVRRRRRPLLLRRRLRRVRPRRLRDRALLRARAGEGAGREDHLRRARELGGSGDDRARGRDPAHEPGRPCLHQAPHARRGCNLRRRGLRPLLLPRLLAGRFGRRPFLLMLELVSNGARSSRRSSDPSERPTSSPAS